MAGEVSTGQSLRTGEYAANEVEAPAAADVSLLALQSRLYQIVITSETRDVFLVNVLRLIKHLTNASGVFFTARSEKGELVHGPRVFQRQKKTWDEKVEPRVLEWANAAVEHGSARVNRFPEDKGAVMISVPITGTSLKPEILSVLLMISYEPIEPFVTIIQLTAGYIAFWQAHHSLIKSEWEANVSAALLELLSHVADCEDDQQACYTIVNEIRSLIPCHRTGTVIGTLSGEECLCEIRAVSGMSNFVAGSEIVRSYQAALAESVSRNEIVVWPPSADAYRSQLPAHQNLANLTGASSIISSPLRTMSGRLTGAWTFLSLKDEQLNPLSVNVIKAAGPHVAMILQLVTRATPGRFRSLARKARAWHAVLIMAFALSIATLSVLPVFHHRISCRCKVQPVTRRTVSSPFQGILKKSMVKVGDLVTNDQVLAQMDGRDVEWELAGLSAEKQRADKLSDVNLAGTQVAAAQMAQLEKRKFEEQIKIQQYKISNLNVRSPLTGIVISGDLERAEGASLSLGQKLFEIAPLDKMLVETAIPAEDISYARKGAAVEVRFEGYPDRKWTGILEKIRPRSEILDMENSFIGEVTLDNRDGLLRPGMDGSARVEEQCRPLVWILFHRPWEFLIAKLAGW